ncbi:MAG: ribose 5-phosphate isomerase B [Lachnospiraceae bacterium]|nr:ribose 5-phosphate isomerase B [Lachnospiraceae bacterium]
MKIAIGSDHTGFFMKQEIMAYLREQGHEVTDCGTYSAERCDYPIYGERVALAIKAGEAERGVLICGTGVGISLAANKVKGIRAGVCSEPYTARMTRQHNNSQIIAFGARVVGPAMAKMIVDAFLDAEFEGGRHTDRVALITEIENRQE